MKHEASYESETFIVPDDTTAVFVVYMIYSTGDSFGCADGKIDIIHCTSSEDAAYADVKDQDVLEVVYSMGNLIRDMTFDEIRANSNK